MRPGARRGQIGWRARILATLFILSTHACLPDAWPRDMESAHVTSAMALGALMMRI